MFSPSNRFAVKSPVPIRANLTLKFEYRTNAVASGYDEYTGNPIYATEVFEAIASVVTIKAPAGLRQDIPGVMASSIYLKGFLLNALPSEIDARVSDRVAAVMINASGEEVEGEFMLQIVPSAFSDEIKTVAGIPIEGFWQVSGGAG